MAPAPVDSAAVPTKQRCREKVEGWWGVFVQFLVQCMRFGGAWLEGQGSLVCRYLGGGKGHQFFMSVCKQQRATW